MRVFTGVLKRRYFALSVALAPVLLGSEYLIQAQTEARRTPGEVAKEFVDSLITGNGRRADQLVARRSYDELAGSYMVNTMLKDLAQGLSPERWEVAAGPAGASGATARVTPVFKPKEVLLVREGGVWRVDLTSTYGRWRKMSKAQVYQQARHLSGTVCENNLKQLALGMMQYAQDWDEKLPPANTWSDAIYPYIKSLDVYHCPATGLGQSGYGMNRNLSRLPLSGVQNLGAAVALYDSRGLQRNHSGGREDVQWRHEGGAFYAFVDGHVKWFPRARPQRFAPGR